MVPENCKKGQIKFLIEQKAMNVDHDFLFPPKKGEKENELAKILIKGHAFLLDQVLCLCLSIFITQYLVIIEIELDRYIFRKICNGLLRIGVSKI